MADIYKEQNHSPEKIITAPAAETPEKIDGRQESREKESNFTPEKATEAPPVRKRSNFLKRQPALVLPSHDPLTLRVEKILEENVGEAYSRLSPIAQQEFKLKGEVTAQKIAELLKATHVKVKKIFSLILEWLRMLPGVNRFFLEQEAKIKTDRIMALYKHK